MIQIASMPETIPFSDTGVKPYTEKGMFFLQTNFNRIDMLSWRYYYYW